jgi:hypothetical protein
MEKFPAGASQLSPRTLSLRAMAGTFRDKLAKTFFRRAAPASADRAAMANSRAGEFASATLDSVRYFAPVRL